jgi:hypothetical protein
LYKEQTPEYLSKDKESASVFLIAYAQFCIYSSPLQKILMTIIYPEPEFDPPVNFFWLVSVFISGEFVGIRKIILEFPLWKEVWKPLV